MKKFWIILGTILCCLCIGVDVWCFCVYKYAQEKIISSTYEVGVMETADGSDKKTFLEINYFKNTNKNGLEMFEIKYNYFMDERHDKFVSMGSQYFSETSDASINWSYENYYKTADINYKKEHYGIFNAGIREYHRVYFETTMGSGSSCYEYQSADDYNFSIGNGVNRITDDRRFKVTLNMDGEDVSYEIGFKGAKPTEQSYLGKVIVESSFTQDINERYAYIDNDYLGYYLYTMCQNSTITTGSYEILQLADYFNYYQDADGDNVYEQQVDVNNSKITTEINNYFVVKINVSEDGARFATDSMFNQIAGDSKFNFTGEYVSEDYAYGKSIIDVCSSDFDIIELDDGTYTLTLKDEFVNYYKPYVKSILLNVNVNLNDIAIDKEFNGFTVDSFKGFMMYKIYTYKSAEVTA